MSVTSGRVYRRVKTTAVVTLFLSLCLVFAGVLNVRSASAEAMMFFVVEPAPISNSTTQTFEFFAFDTDTEGEYEGDFECKVDSDAFAPCTSPYATPELTAGDHTFTAHAVGQSAPSATISFAWNINQLPMLSGSTNVSGTAGIPIAVTDLQIDDADDDILLVNLAVPSGTLQLGTTAGITFSGSSTGMDITFNGTRTNLNTALATLTYTPNVAGAVTIEATLRGAATGSRDTFAGHVYQIITSNTVWDAAKSAAEASTFGGVSGYLANVTSAEEEAYLQERMGSWMWIGGSDSTSEGEWGWTGGPENNTIFWSGGSAVDDAYTLWQTLQPDNNGEEDCLELRRNSSISWNDEKCGNGRPYIIEYGAPGGLPLLDSAEVSTSAVAAALGVNEEEDEEEEKEEDEDGIPSYFEVWTPSTTNTENDSINEDDDTETTTVTPVTTDSPDTNDEEQQPAFQFLIYIPLGLLVLATIIILILRRRKES
jgi:hypothetical protein